MTQAAPGKDECMNAEQRKVRAFCKEFLSWKAESVGMWIGAGILEVLYVIMMMIPYQEMKTDMAFIVFPLMFGYLGPMLYISPYLTFREGTNVVYIYEKLKYLPIDRKEIRKMRVTKLVLFVGKIFPIVCIVQLLFTYFGYGEILLEDIVYACLMGFIWPFATNLGYTWLGK